MGNLLQQLENNEAILLMYLADELEPQDRAEVEEMLASDAHLRDELEQLRESHQMVLTGLDELEAADAIKLPKEASLRQIGRRIRQWQLQNRPTTIPLTQRKGLAYPWWAYPTAAAAAVLLAFTVWWGNHNGGPIQLGLDGPTYVQTNTDPLMFSLRGDALFDPTGHTEVMEPLNDAENQLAALYASSDSGQDAWLMDTATP